MSGRTEPLVPAIDDAYWFEYSKKLIDSSLEKRDAAAAVIQKLVVWLWGIYTASAAIGFNLSGKELSLVPALIIAGASGGLILVYWGTVWVQMPVGHAFDPNSPTEIEAAYNRAVKTKSRRLSTTLLGSVLAAIMVSLALMAASVSKPVKRDYANIAAAIEEDDGNRILSVTGWVGETDKVDVAATPLTPDPESTKPVRTVVLPSKEGLVQTGIALPPGAEGAVRLTLRWKSPAGTDIEISRDIE